MKSLDLDRTTRRAEADAALRPQIPEDAIRLFLLQNLVATPAGMRWRINLDAIIAGMADLAAFPAFPAGVKFPGPTLVVRGAQSDYVADHDLPAFRRLFPAMRLVTIDGADHWVHAERSAEFLAAVMPFLAAS
jgi:pimeloyl-ACP methyl ester carboxylesterase